MPRSTAILLFIFSYFIHVSYAQEETVLVKGQVVDEGGQPLALATVVLVDKDNKERLKMAADSTGLFSFSIDRKIHHSIIISHSGYTPYRSPIPLTTDLGKITLVSSQSLKEVVVESKQKLVEQDGSNIIYNVSKSIAAQGLSAFEVLKRAPGVYVDNETTISLNGKQGVSVLLDGKQTYLSGKELIDLLKSMPSTYIRSIEIITSPTAKYDASGSAGILNIKTNKNATAGFNGTATAGVAYGITVRQNADVSMNYRRNKLNLYGSYNHFIGHATYAYGSDRIQLNRSFASYTDDTDKRNRLGARLGIDYTPRKGHVFGFLINSNFVLGGGITNTKTKIGNPNSQVIEQVLDAENDYYFQETKRYNFNANYTYENAGGTILSIDADYGSFSKGNGNFQTNIYSSNNNLISEHYYRTLNDIGINLKALKTDYSTNLWKGKLEAGAKFSNVHADNDSKFYHALTSSDSLDDRRSNFFRFNEDISAGYLSYKKGWGKWTVQGGLRLEHSASDGSLFFRSNGHDSTELVRRNFTHLFPSFSIGVVPIADHNLSLAYSRRIDRPAYQDLNPFVYLLDELSFWQGNPFLQPQLTHRLSLQFSRKNTSFVTLAYSYADQYSTRITDTVDNDKIVMVQRNVGVQKNISLTVTQQVSPAKWWDISLNGVFYRLHNEIKFDQYRNFDLKQVAGRVSLQQTFKLPNKFTGELSATYNSKRLSGANDIARAVSYVDIGLQRKLLKDKATLRLVFSDIYKGNQPENKQQYSGFYLRSYGYYESRQLRLNFTYRFADSSVKGPRTRNSALEAESGRIRN